MNKSILNINKLLLFGLERYLFMYKINNMKWTKKELEFLIANYSINGVSYCESHLNRSRKQIISKANYHMLTTTICDRGENKKKKQINSDLFINHLTKESVYILGLLWADGHLRKNGNSRRIILNCIKTDIEDVKSIFESTGEWSFSKPIKKYYKQKIVKDQLTISCTNWVLYDYLEQFEYVNKSHSTPTLILTKIPEHLKKYWFRGYLDGDGCIRVNSKQTSIVFTSVYNQNWDFLIKLCENLNIKYCESNTKIKLGGYSHFTIYKKNDVKLFCEYIYNNYFIEKIGFKRKYQKYLEVLKFINKRNK